MIALLHAVTSDKPFQASSKTPRLSPLNEPMTFTEGIGAHGDKKQTNLSG